MNKIIILALVLILIAGAGYGYYQYSHPDSATITPTATTTPVATTTETLVINMDSGGFYFKPNIIKAKVGQKVTVLVNAVGNMHNFAIDELGINVQTPGGKITEITFTPDKAGSFEFYCAMAGHRQKGQWGTLIVE